MKLPNNIKQHLGGTPYINVGDETCSVFVPMSLHLIKILKRYPFIHSAMVEGAKCAQNGYFCSGILAYSQLIKEFAHSEPEERHVVAHEFLKRPPSKEEYELVTEIFNEIAIKKIVSEFSRSRNKKNNYKETIENEWTTLMETK